MMRTRSSQPAVDHGISHSRATQLLVCKYRALPSCSSWYTVRNIALFIVLFLLLATPAVNASTNDEPKSILKSLSSLGNSLGLSGSKKAFLEPDKAFKFSADVKDGHTLAPNWDIAEGYYLYKEKFSFVIINTDGVTISSISFPNGEFKEDESFGLMEVYHDQVSPTLTLLRENLGPLPVILEAKYQGCAESGFCYPPMTKTTELLLPAVTTSQAISGNNEFEILSEQDQIVGWLSGEKSLFITLLLLFGYGLLLAFTPCVFPMVPILSSIIVGHGKKLTTRKAFFLSLTYVLAMALTYTAAGVIAGLFGKNMQIIFQNPLILGTFSMVFVLLALSMFGFYDIQLPTHFQSKLNNLSHKQQGGTFFGAGIMGFLSALIVGPCVAAPLAGVLIFIGLSGDALIGGLSLFAISLGMGLPLLLIGTSAGKWLPKAGPWMETTKKIFGVLLLALAIWLLERIIPPQATMALWAILLIVSAVYMGAFDKLGLDSTGWQKFLKGSAIIFLVYGIMLLVGAASNGSDMLHPLKGLTTSSNQAGSAHILEFKQIKGLAGLNRQIEAARTQQKNVMLDFYADWCIDCKIMEKRTFTDPNVQYALRNTILLQADVTDNDEIDQALLKHFNLFGPPAILFFGPDGTERNRYRLIGFLEPEKFGPHIEKALK